MGVERRGERVSVMKMVRVERVIDDSDSTFGIIQEISNIQSNYTQSDFTYFFFAII